MAKSGVLKVFLPPPPPLIRQTVDTKRRARLREGTIQASENNRLKRCYSLQRPWTLWNSDYATIRQVTQPPHISFPFTPILSLHHVMARHEEGPSLSIPPSRPSAQSLIAIPPSTTQAINRAGTQVMQKAGQVDRTVDREYEEQIASYRLLVSCSIQPPFSLSSLMLGLVSPPGSRKKSEG